MSMVATVKVSMGVSGEDFWLGQRPQDISGIFTILGKQYWFLYQRPKFVRTMVIYSTDLSDRCSSVYLYLKEIMDQNQKQTGSCFKWDKNSWSLHSCITAPVWKELPCRGKTNFKMNCEVGSFKAKPLFQSLICIIWIWTIRTLLCRCFRTTKGNLILSSSHIFAVEWILRVSGVVKKRCLSSNSSKPGTWWMGTVGGQNSVKSQPSFLGDNEWRWDRTPKLFTYRHLRRSRIKSTHRKSTCNGQVSLDQPYTLRYPTLNFTYNLPQATWDYQSLT